MWLSVPAVAFLLLAQNGPLQYEVVIVAWSSMGLTQIVLRPDMIVCQALTMSTVVLVSMCRYSIHMIDLRQFFGDT